MMDVWVRESVGFGDDSNAKLRRGISAAVAMYRSERLERLFDSMSANGPSAPTL